MSRYIDADVLIDAIESCSYTTWSQDINRVWWAQAVKVKDNMVECIKNTPTADVVEVRHGEWRNRDLAGISIRGYMVCSCCNVMIPTCDDFRYCLPRLYFCPKCGAKMDGERKEANEG